MIFEQVIIPQIEERLLQIKKRKYSAFIRIGDERIKYEKREWDMCARCVNLVCSRGKLVTIFQTIAPIAFTRAPNLHNNRTLWDRNDTDIHIPLSSVSQVNIPGLVLTFLHFSQNNLLAKRLFAVWFGSHDYFYHYVLIGSYKLLLSQVIFKFHTEFSSLEFLFIYQNRLKIS